jgi:glycosyltransferase involved in cell wall biosynthesis
LWTPEHDGRAGGVALRVAGRPLKSLDRRRAAETAEFAANSEFIRERIQRAWDRDARVIYPPVDVERIQAVDDWRDRLAPVEQRAVDALPSEFLLGASRFVPYKRLDLVIAAGEAVGLPVVIAGSGTGADQLRAQAETASVPVHFVHSPSDELLFVLYQRALALIFLAVEDFGIMPVEAMACGTPVVVNAIGGARESVAAPVGGTVVDEFSPAELARAVGEVAGLDRDVVAENARRFGNSRFDAELAGWVGTGDSSSADTSSDRRARGI